MRFPLRWVLICVYTTVKSTRGATMSQIWAACLELYRPFACPYLASSTFTAPTSSWWTISSSLRSKILGSGRENRRKIMSSIDPAKACASPASPYSYRAASNAASVPIDERNSAPKDCAKYYMKAPSRTFYANCDCLMHLPSRAKLKNNGTSCRRNISSSTITTWHPQNRPKRKWVIWPRRLRYLRKSTKEQQIIQLV